MNSPSFQSQVEQICELVKQRAVDNRRTVIAIAGPPASGKSTLSEAVVEKLCTASDKAYPLASLLPMDGYHLDNPVLQSRGLLQRKGAPETFDAYGFCDAVKRLSSTDHELFYPRFDRKLDMAIANSIVVHPKTPVVVVEGNYLLLKTSPWSSLAEHFVATIFLNPGLEELQQRLIQRWLDQGLDFEAATSRANGNDIPNARLVLNESRLADINLGEDAWPNQGAFF